ncbi:DEAD-domain-containing protein [Leucogyrophana mollusca]|uniref:DEAD-domain-containing protein n=1 Tax=Leucogyrophana mollusca TaxID=85980 RepID=A0ACB8BYF6_9AGAM|nr:DEAD-domain-containing protein [Leucogyrophana mollusca]
MTRRKHPRVTTDELMRLQEDRPRKRFRSMDSRNSVSDDFLDSDNIASLDDSVEEGIASDTEDDDSSNDENRPSEPPQASDTIESEDRFNLSRIASRHRTEITGPSIQRPCLADSFDEMNISPVLQAALLRMSIRVPTEIQAACIPPLLSGRDCIGNAKTGSGKTVAFAIPILQRLSDDPYGVFALVLTPTRELAFQIAEQFAVLGAGLSVRTSVVVGGMDMMAQALELGSRPHVIVATPGRIVDHLRSSSGEWDLSRVKFLVLDEADRLLTSTFAPELAYLFNVLPKERQTCLFTATLTPSIDALAEAPPRPGKMKPFIHKMESTVETVATLKQHYVLVPSHVREPYLYHVLCNPPENTIPMRRAPPEPVQSTKNKVKPKGRPSRKNTVAEEDELIQPPPTIIFCTKPRTAAYLTNLLKTLSIRSTALHSRLTQRERLNSLSLFRASVVPVLVSTDVGARGLDIEGVAMVINWDLPNEPEEYTHRVGRTARAGKSGVAISFVTEKDEDRMIRIEERIGTKLVGMTLPEDQVLKKLNAVSTAKRLANMELHDSNFGKREEIHKIKSQKRRANGS